MAQWGARWTEGGNGLRFVNRHTGASLAAMAVRDVDGVELGVSDLALASDPGPG